MRDYIIMSLYRLAHLILQILRIQWNVETLKYNFITYLFTYVPKLTHSSTFICYFYIYIFIQAKGLAIRSKLFGDSPAI